LIWPQEAPNNKAHALASTALCEIQGDSYTGIFNIMAITLTSKAADRVQQYLQKEGGKGLRLGVKRTGCSGWAYTVGLDSEPGLDDIEFVDQGVKIFVARENLGFLDGTQIDFVSEGLSHTFRFENPNVTEQCGCGESFTVN
jgi:iron-sulfur cluster assembly protein